MCLYDHFKTFGKICLVVAVLVCCGGSDSGQCAEALRIVTNSDRYPADAGPFLSVQPVDGDWSAPYKLQSVRYVGFLPSDVVLNSVGYYSPGTGKAYFYVSDARTIYLPGPYVGIAQAINNNLDRFGLGTVVARQRQIDALTFEAPKIVDPSNLWTRLLQILGVWVLASLILALPVLVVLLGWRRFFQLFLIHEVGKTIRGLDDGSKD